MRSLSTYFPYIAKMWALCNVHGPPYKEAQYESPSNEIFLSLFFLGSNLLKEIYNPN